MRYYVSDVDLREARALLIDAARAIKVYERGQEDPEHTHALLIAARQFAAHAGQLLRPRSEWES